MRPFLANLICLNLKLIIVSCVICTVFRYKKKRESVLVVNEDDYLKCNTKGEHIVFKDGNTEVVFMEAGKYYFISGNPRNCRKGLKLSLLVLPKPLPRGLLPPPPPSPSSASLSPLSSPPSPLSPPPSTSPSPSPNSSGSQGAPILPPSPAPLLSPLSSDSQRGNGNARFIMWLGGFHWH